MLIPARHRKTTAVLVASESTDSKGDTETTYATGAAFACMLQPVSGAERAMGGKTGVRADMLMLCDPAPITERDRVRIDGRDFDVTFVGDFSDHLEVELAERRG